MSNGNPNYYEEWLLIQSKHKEAERAFRQHQLAETASPNSQHGPTLFCRILLTAGSWLIEQGWRLQQSGEADTSDVLEWGKIEVHRHVHT